MAGPLLRRGKIEEMIHIGLIGHHLISFARQAVAGAQNASFYSPTTREKEPMQTARDLEPQVRVA
jgi:hypothetical protein